MKTNIVMMESDMNFEVIYAKNLKAYLRTHPALVIDVRSAREFRNGHWPGALNLPYEELKRWENNLPGTAVLVFYCSHGGNSMQIARKLGQRGFHTASVIGGFPAMAKWMENN